MSNDFKPFAINIKFMPGITAAQHTNMMELTKFLAESELTCGEIRQAVRDYKQAQENKGTQLPLFPPPSFL